MTNLLDANVLIALVVVEHVHHRAAEKWFTQEGGAFATCPSTQGSLVRMLVRGGLDGPTAAAVLDALEADERHEFWPDDLPYSRVGMKGVVGHRQVTDSYLAAMARARGGRLVTFDKGLVALHPGVTDPVPTT